MERPRAGCSAECHPITIHGVGFVHGIGTYSVSEMWIDLKGSATKFVSAVGVDDDADGKGSVGFEVWADGKKLADTGVMRGGSEAKLLTVDLRGVKQLLLRVNDGGDGGNYDRADWAGGILELVPGAKAQPESILPPWPAGPPIRTKMSRGRRCTARRSPAPRRASRFCFSCPPAASRRFSSRPRISPPA